jgi:hypothetical protein
VVIKAIEFCLLPTINITDTAIKGKCCVAHQKYIATASLN